MRTIHRPAIEDTREERANMLEWDTTVHESEPDAEFRARTTTDGEFTATYAAVGRSEGCDIYSYAGTVYLSRLDDEDDKHAIILTASMMNALAKDWLRWRGHFPWTEDK